MRIVISLVILFIGSGAAAQQSLLVKITPPEGGKPSYIFSANNNAMVTQYDFESILSEAARNVNTVAFEWLPENYELENMLEVMKNEEGQTLLKYYKREDNIRYELMIINKLQEDVDKYWNLQPLYTLQVFRNKDYADGLNFQQGILKEVALQQTKPAISLMNLRTIREQLGMIDFDSQAAILSNYVNKEATFKVYEEEKWRFYEKQNLEGFYNSITAIEHPVFVESILNKRASVIADKIVALSAQQSILYFLDASIVGGNNGVLQNLKLLRYATEDIPVTLEKRLNAEEVNLVLNDTNITDAFPEILFDVAALPTDMDNTYAIQLSNIQQQFSNGYMAMYDPFGDLLDYDAQDTSFLNSWYEVKSTDANLNVRVPVKSTWEETTTETLNGTVKSSTMAMNHARSDLYYSVGYTIYPPNFDAGDKAIFFDDIVYRAVRKLKGDILAQRLISAPDYIGREFTVVVSDSFFVRSQIVLKGNILYQFLTGGPGDNVYSAYATAFFNHIEIEAGKSGNWVLLNNATFSCELPSQPLVQKQTYNTQYGPLEVQTFNAQDYKEDIAYFISVNAYPPGYNFKRTTEFYDDLIANAERQYVGRAVKIETVKKNGIKGRYVELQLNNQKIYKMYIFFDHNLVHQYLAGGTVAAMQSLSPEYFFSKFRFGGEEF